MISGLLRSARNDIIFKNIALLRETKQSRKNKNYIRLTMPNFFQNLENMLYFCTFKKEIMYLKHKMFGLKAATLRGWQFFFIFFA